uniref:Ig-like domain-containing protein n=1 Tax=Anopheles coluzzii TaxID=1518534 RepID=A0A6E8VV99_ANOCL
MYEQQLPVSIVDWFAFPIVMHATTASCKKHGVLIFWIIFLLSIIEDYALAIKLTEVRVPKHAIRGQDVMLECHYDMEGEALYSVKWYKDGREFYRYVPRDDPPQQTFPVEGITVNVQNSTNSHVMLESINLFSSGKYRCEASAEAPSFQTVAENGEMMVVVLPESDPFISGGRPRYQIGDHVRVNCTSARSKPAVQLAWYINSELADPAYVQHYPTIVSLAPDHLETSILGLEFRIKPKHFRRGDLKLKCLATISTVYWKSNEESMESDRPQKAPILESRKSGLSTASRADRVQANNGVSSHQVPAQSSLATIVMLSVWFTLLNTVQICFIAR